MFSRVPGTAPHFICVPVASCHLTRLKPLQRNNYVFWTTGGPIKRCLVACRTTKSVVFVTSGRNLDTVPEFKTTWTRCMHGPPYLRNGDRYSYKSCGSATLYKAHLSTFTQILSINTPIARLYPNRRNIC